MEFKFPFIFLQLRMQARWMKNILELTSMFQVSLLPILRLFNEENRLLKTDAKSQPICIKEIVYRCPDERNLNNNLRMIKELRKRWTTREAVDAARGGPDKEQEKLILSKGKRSSCLHDD